VELFQAGDTLNLIKAHDKARKRAQNVVKYIKNAAKLHFAVEMLMEVEGIDVEYDLDSKGNVNVSQQPITISSVSNKKLWKALSPFQVFKLGNRKVVDAVNQVAVADQYSRLIKFLNKGAGETGSGLKAGTMDQAFDMADAFGSFFDIGSREGRDRIALMQGAIKKKDGTEWLLSLVHLKRVVNTIVSEEDEVRAKRIEEGRAKLEAQKQADLDAMQPEKKTAVH
jgi:hypothetical protein